MINSLESNIWITLSDYKSVHIKRLQITRKFTQSSDYFIYLISFTFNLTSIFRSPTQEGLWGNCCSLFNFFSFAVQLFSCVLKHVFCFGFYFGWTRRFWQRPLVISESKIDNFEKIYTIYWRRTKLNKLKIFKLFQMLSGLFLPHYIQIMIIHCFFFFVFVFLLYKQTRKNNTKVSYSKNNERYIYSACVHNSNRIHTKTTRRSDAHWVLSSFYFFHKLQIKRKSNKNSTIVYCVYCVYCLWITWLVVEKRIHERTNERVEWFVCIVRNIYVRCVFARERERNVNELSREIIIIKRPIRIVMLEHNTHCVYR